MRVLLLTQWYPPEPQKLLSDAAVSLQALGHDVTVLTGFPNYPSGKLYAGYRLKCWQVESMDGVRVIRVPLYPDHSMSAVKRVANYVSFAVSAAALGPLLTGRPDVIFVLHPPLTAVLAARVLGSWWRVPFVLDVVDLWPETLPATGMVTTPWVLRLTAWLALAAYRAATAIIVLSPGFSENLAGKGVPVGKISVVHSWVDTDHYRPVQPDTHLAGRLGLSGHLRVIFAGVMGLAQGLDAVLAAASQLSGMPVQFVFVGDGVDLPRLRGVAAEHGLSNVLFLGRYPEAQMPQILALADVALLHLRDAALFRITIPHKLYTYLACGKPVLAAIRGDAADVVAAYDAGLCCAPDNPEALASAVRKLLSMERRELRRMGDNGRRAACQCFSRSRQAERIAGVLERALVQHANPN